MKTFSLLLSAFFTLATLLTATPDWTENTYEKFLGSNKDRYATIKTVIDNQGSHYSWREIKILTEYSKANNAILNSQTISDIVYNIDATHDDPNTAPTITKKVNETNDTVKLSYITKEYHISALPHQKGAGVERLSWKDNKLVLDEKITVLTKTQLENLEIFLEQVTTKPPKEIVSSVNTDFDCFYLTLNVDLEPEEGTRVVCISSKVSKIIRDRIFIKPSYPLLGDYKTREEANTAALDLIKLCHDKNFFSILPEIWSVKKDNKLSYFLVQHPIEEDKIKELELISNKSISMTSSDLFIEKWRPYAPQPKLEEQPDPEPEEEELEDSNNLETLPEVP